VEPAAREHSFVLDDGRFTSFDVRGAVLTNAYDITNKGQVVGQYYDADDGEQHATPTAPTPGCPTRPARCRRSRSGSTTRARSSARSPLIRRTTGRRSTASCSTTASSR
jgi:hypothetical protein